MLNLRKYITSIQRPGRYVGGEINAYLKPFELAEVRVVFVFPDVYELGMSGLGMELLYHIVNRIEYAMADRAYLPWVDMRNLMREKGELLFGIESKRPIKEFDIVAFSVGYELNYTNVLECLSLAGIPVQAGNCLLYTSPSPRD